MKRIGKMLKAVMVIIAMGALGYLLLVAAYSLPTNLIEENVKESSVYFDNGNENILGSKSATLDNYTDALMLLIAVHESGDSNWDEAIECANYEMLDEGAEGSLEDIYKKGKYPETEVSYGRYWHGYLIFLKPLLLFMNYGEIRNLLMILQVSIFAILLIIAKEKKKEITVPIVLLWLFLNPMATMLSLQYNTMCLITFGSMLFIICKLDKWDQQKMYQWMLTFMTIGVLTSYFDFLTYPLLSLGVPLVLWMTQNCTNQILKNIKMMIQLSIPWGIGYGGMWATKWIIGDLLTDSHIISNAIEAILFRTSSNVGNEPISYFQVLKAQLIHSPGYVWIILGALIISCLIHYIISKNIEVTKIFTYMFISAMPFLWYFVLKNHSYIHAKYTYRILGITVFALSGYIFSKWNKNKN